MSNSKKITITEKQKKILIPLLAATVLITALGYLIYYTNNELQLIRRQISDAKRKEKAITELGQLKAKEETLLKAFPRAQDKNDIIKEITGWARKEGLEVTDIEPTESSVASTDFKQLSFVLTGHGSYLPIMRFLKRVEASSYFVLTSGLTLQGFDLSRQKSRVGSKVSQDVKEGPFKITINLFLLE